MITKDLITAALRKIGPCGIGALASNLGVERSALQYHLKLMPDLKYAGNRLTRIVGLPDQKLDGATTETAPKPKHQGKARKGHRPKKRHEPKQPRARRAEPEEVFIPAVDADLRLVCINGGTAPTVFTRTQTERIATLLLQHFEG